jgi:AhpD family alkylhydroperoxidase
MPQRLNPKNAAPKPYELHSALQDYVDTCGLEHALLELVKLRASQINGCAFCIAMHTTEAVEAGERQERLHLLNAWAETDLYTPRERAALAWTEALTRLPEAHAPDDVYDEMRAHFSEKEAVDLTWCIITINSWNRLMAGFRVPPVIKAVGTR